MVAQLKPLILSYIPPFLMSSRIYDILADTQPQTDHIFPQATWTFAKKGVHGDLMPQTIAHRGYKVKFPENTMASFRAAVDVGAHALETDVHLTKDGVVVLSHDATLERCFGRKEKIIDCTWDYISTLRTLKAPHEQMPRLIDLLEYLAALENENAWLLLDIKLDDDADEMMRRIGQTIASITPSAENPWCKRIVLGIWAQKYLPLCATHLPTFAVTHIGFSTSYARTFFAHPHVSFNLLQKVLYVWPFGVSFIRDARAHQRAVMVWTCNEEPMMRWSINQGLDGVITDDPKRFGEVCEEWARGKRAESVSWRTAATALWIWGMVNLFGVLLFLRQRVVKGKESV